MEPGTGAVVDTDAAQEFMREALQMIGEPDLDAIAEELMIKSERFQAVLGPQALPAAPADRLRGLLRTVFATRRRADEILALAGPAQVRELLFALLHGPGAVQERFDAFDHGLEAVEPALRRDLAGEALHFYAPQQHWLWTRWMWDPDLDTGALPLVTMREFDLRGGSAGETYLRVGQAVAFVNRTGRAVGFTRYGQEAFGIDVYLACVYGVYLYTITRMRMTQEFNKVIPPLPQLARRLLGTHRMEV